MNILFFHYSMQAGGAERTIALLSDYATRQGNNVTIMTMDNRESFYMLNQEVRHLKLALEYNSSNIGQAIKNNLVRIKAIKSILKKNDPNIVICFGINTIFLSWLCRGKMQYKIVGSERTNPYCNNYGFWNKSKKWISRLCDGFLFQTNGARSYYPTSTQKVGTILPNSIIASEFMKLDKPWSYRKNICAVGRLDDDKCFDDILFAFSKIYDKYPNVHLNIYGDGPNRNNLEALSQKLGLGEVVSFCGRCKDILDEYSKHKIFVMASRLEGMPNVLMEAMASGCACVATNCDFGPNELIHDGGDGFLVPVSDRNAIAERLCNLLDNDNLCQSFSKAAKEIRNTHDLEIIGKYFNAYLERI